MAWVNVIDFFDPPFWGPETEGVSIVGDMIVGRNATVDSLTASLIQISAGGTASVDFLKGVRYNVLYWIERPDNQSPPSEKSRVAYPKPIDVTENFAQYPAQSFIPGNQQIRFPISPTLYGVGFGFARYSGAIIDHPRSVPTDFALQIFVDYVPPVPSAPEPIVKYRKVPTPLKACDISDQWSNCK